MKSASPWMKSHVPGPAGLCHSKPRINFAKNKSDDVATKRLRLYSNASQYLNLQGYLISLDWEIVKSLFTAHLMIA